MNTINNQNNLSQSQLVALSQRGPREENQDNYLIIDAKGRYRCLQNETLQKGRVKNWSDQHIRLVVADGMGGHHNGRQASEAVVQALLALEFQTDPQQLKDALFHLQSQLFERFHQGSRTPGSTLVMADIDANGQAVIANIGDSRAYLFNGKIWKLLTKDHTMLEFAYRDHEVSKDVYSKGLLQNTNRIAQAMIFGSSGIIVDENGEKNRQHQPTLRLDSEDVFSCQLKSGEVLMLASDGLWSGQNNYATPATIEGDVATYAQQQMDIIENVTRDNISLVLCHFETDNGDKNNNN